MNPTIAFYCCTVFVIWILKIERKYNKAPSFFVWIPTIWFLICGSRPVARWFEFSYTSDEYDNESGSPIDRIILGSIIILSCIIVMNRGINWKKLLRNNRWLIILYIYLGVSILWSDMPTVSAKRWIRLLGLIPVALVIISEKSPLCSMESIFRRCAYLLIPYSLLTEKYFPEIGVVFNRWTGQRMWVGVTLHKNSLGIICAISILVLIFSIYRYYTLRDSAKKQQNIVDVIIIIISFFLMRGPGGSYSATSILTLFVGLIIMIVLFKNQNLAVWITENLNVLLVISIATVVILDTVFMPIVTSLLGRSETLTDRIYIWKLALDIASKNPIFGVGYGSFWGLESEISMKYNVTQAHNGYIGVFLEVGCTGVLILFFFLFEFCKKIKGVMNYDRKWAILGICFMIMLMLWNYSEDTFLKTSYLWSLMILFNVVFSLPKLNQTQNINGKLLY